MSAAVAPGGAGPPPPGRGRPPKNQPRDKPVLPKNSREEKRWPTEQGPSNRRPGRIITPKKHAKSEYEDDDVIWSATQSKYGESYDDDDDVVFTHANSRVGSSQDNPWEVSSDSSEEDVRSPSHGRARGARVPDRVSAALSIPRGQSSARPSAVPGTPGGGKKDVRSPNHNKAPRQAPGRASVAPGGSDVQSPARASAALRTPDGQSPARSSAAPHTPPGPSLLNPDNRATRSPSESKTRSGARYASATEGSSTSRKKK